MKSRVSFNFCKHACSGDAERSRHVRGGGRSHEHVELHDIGGVPGPGMEWHIMSDVVDLTFAQTLPGTVGLHELASLPCATTISVGKVLIRDFKWKKPVLGGFFVEVPSTPTQLGPRSS